MASQDLLTKFRRYRRRLNGSTVEYDLSEYRRILAKIDAFKTQFANNDAREIRREWQRLKTEVEAGKPPDAIVHKAFAIVREMIWRHLKLRPFDAQVIGALAMHRGKLAEMQTGEGKTLTAVFPASLNALTGKGVHVLTFNDYLARRDAEWMAPVYQALELKVDFVQQSMSIEQRQKAYRADVTYLTAKEAGFDFLRDSLRHSPENIVHRAFHYAIIDEADSILIDEARVPLVIAAASDEFAANVIRMAEIVKGLDENEHIEFDDDARNVLLSETGISRVEEILRRGSLYGAENAEQLTRINCALHAEYLLHRDVDYIVRDGKIELVDEFTGRVAEKRRWPDGLQAAVEAKEGVTAQSKGKILNSIALRHFLRLYPKICGMTATAQIAEEEFREFYDLHTVVIPPHKPCIRTDGDDLLFQTKSAKQAALTEEIVRVHQTGQPVLVGTRSVQESARLARDLREKGVKCEVLNAKRDAFEAMIVARAGKLGAVTISTNMAGRGTDILLGAGDEKEKRQVAALGGLHVIGANRHESLRIDNQLRGRAGRQGDPGSSRFIISLEDDLFQKYRLHELLPTNQRYFEQGGRIENPIITREIQRLQRIIETQHLEIKKTLFQYSELVEKQRRIIFQIRHEIVLGNADIDFFAKNAPDHLHFLQPRIDGENLRRICRKISLFCLDKAWADYLATIVEIREGIHLNRLGGREPFFEFQKQMIDLFEELHREIDAERIQVFESVAIKGNEADLEGAGLKTPSATWTYLVNDNPFDNALGLSLLGNFGTAFGAGMLGPLVALTAAYKKVKSK